MTNEVRQQREPHLRERVCATWSAAGPAEAAQAIDAALAARHDWSAWSLADRSAILVRAADLLAGPWRQRVNAATMLGQGKTVREAEIDAAAELADFWRFNVYFAEQIAEQQPISTPGIHNRMEQRGLEGFVYAVTPFNFTAIGGNLPTAPALMGNTVVWKPSQTAILSNWLDLPDPARGRAAGRRDQFRARAIPARSPRSASITPSSPACTSPARARSSARSSARSASASTAIAPIRASSARRAARTSSSCTPPPTRRPSPRRSCAAPSSTRDRSARRPRARTSPTRSGPRCASGRWRWWARSTRATRPT